MSEATMPVRAFRWTTVVFWVMLASALGWILSLPVFPTQDGPMHLYWTQVLEALLTHSHRYDGYMALRAVVSPYSLYYFLLIGLTRVMAPPLADKVVICLTVATFCVGLRMFAMSLGEGGRLTSLFGLPLVLGWSLGMGFVSYTLCLGLGLAAMGLWFESVRWGRSAGAMAGFVAALLLMMVTHPVPLLLVLGILGLDVLGRGLPGRRWRGWTGEWRGVLVLVVMGGVAAGFIARFTDRSRVHLADTGEHRTLLAKALRLFSLHTLSLFRGTRPAPALYLLGLYGILFGALWVAVRWWQRRDRGGEERPEDLRLFVALTVVLFLALPMLPEQMNGGKYFGDRLMPAVWVAALAAASCRPWPAAPAAKRVVAFAVGLWALLMFQCEHYLRPIAREDAVLETAPLPALGAPAGIAVNGSNQWMKNGVTVLPHYWQGMRSMRREGAVVMNIPWLTEKVLPLEDGPEEMTRLMGPKLLDDPKAQFTMVDEMAEMRARAGLTPIGFVAFFYGVQPAEGEVFLREMKHVRGGPWRCEQTTRVIVCHAAAG